ncbi:MAG: sensor histidine kinase [Brevinematales bacterium]
MNDKKFFFWKSWPLSRQVRLVTVLLLVMITLFSALFTGILFFQWWKAEYHRQISVSALLATDLVSTDIDTFRRIMIVSVDQLPESAGEVNFRHEFMFGRVRNYFPEIEAVAIYDDSGRKVIFSGEEKWKDMDLQRLFSSSSLSFSPLHYEVVSYPGERQSYLLMKYDTPKKKVIFVFSLISVLSHFSTQLEIYKIAMGVVDAYGNYIVHTDPLKVNTSEGVGHLPGFHEFVSSAKDVVWLSDIGRQGRKSYFFVRINNLPWFVVEEVESSFFFQFVYRFMRLIMLSLLIVLAVSLLIAVKFSTTLQGIFDFFVGYIKAMLTGQPYERAGEGSFQEMEFFVSTVEQLMHSLKAEQQNLLYSRQIIQEIVQSLSEGLLIVRPDGTAVYLNPEGARLLGVPPKTNIESLVQGKGGGFVIPLPLLMAIKPYERFYVIKEEVMIYTAEGEKRWLLVHSKDWCDPDGRFLGKMVMISDVTQRRLYEQRLQVSEKRLTTALETANAIFWDWMIPGDELLLSEDWEKKTGYPLASSLQEWFTQFEKEDAVFLREMVFDYCNGKRQEFSLEHRIPTKNGEEIWVLNKAHVVERDIFRQPLRVIGVMVDITTIKKQQKQIEEALAEKEVLLREIHHRVKNNLQIISSLLSLQADQTEEESIRRVMLDSQVRVRSMAIVHEKLYQSHSFSLIRVREYISDLADAVRSIYDISVPLSIEIEIEDVSLPLEVCIPLGLWVSEALTNAFKYAVSTQEYPLIRISLVSGEEGFVLEVADNGPGLSFEPTRSSGSLGLKLLFILADQLRGKVFFVNDVGLRVRMVFPRP